MRKYLPSELEPKWQKKWKESKLYSSKLDEADPYYVLAEFAYPSGDLHMGHWFTFGGADIYARMKRMQGFNVFFPNGYDSFGLPAENAAIKKGVHPEDWTLFNIDSMRKQFDTMGGSFTFDHQVTTCLPEYYKWNQWIFLRMLEKDIAYRGKAFANWCPSCQTVLADEQVVAGHCDRCGSEVEEKQIDQWFLKITEYADRLEWPKNPEVNWPQAVREGQNNWIGRSEGILLDFGGIEVFTTRPDTLFGATFVVISPEHTLLDKFVKPEQAKKVKQYVKDAAKKTELERKENKEKTGVFTGGYVKNPINGEKIPVLVADYVLASYGTGAIMAVPGHDKRDFEFAKKFGLEIKKVIDGGKDAEAYEGAGKMVNSGEYNGLSSSEAREKISDYIEKHNLGKRQVQYHLHDWSIGRQRYWGTPIPIIHCPKCGVMPVPYEDLPVELPENVEFKPTGQSPLVNAGDWNKVSCPKCGGQAQRETDTMDGFFDNSWYFFRYLDPKNDQEIFDKALAEKWLPLEVYFGGAEHTLGHTLYSRFFTKFFRDIGLTNFDEYAKRRVNHGIVLGPDNEKMSKSRGNVVNPDEKVKRFGADTIRVHMAFFMPYEGTGPWVSERVSGSYRFLQRVWDLQKSLDSDKELSIKDLNIMHRTIQKVANDIEGISFNTAVAALMEWLNHLSKSRVSNEEFKTLLLLLAPFAPHITEELWQGMGLEYSIHQQSWPKFDKKFLEEEEVKVVIQVNGKVRDLIVIGKDIENSKEVVKKLALGSVKIQKFLDGKEIKKVVYVPGKVVNLVV